MGYMPLKIQTLHEDALSLGLLALEDWQLKCVKFPVR